MVGTTRWRPVALSVGIGLVVNVAVLALALTVVAPGRSASAEQGPAPGGGAATNVPGYGTTEATFVPITPCRIVDTRLAGGQLAVGASRSFDVRGDGPSFAAQGGRNDGCDIPTGATGIEATVTAVDARSGFLRLWPAQQSQPNATFLNFDDAFNVSNSGSLALCESACSPTADLQARPYGNPTHLVIEVQGYYAPPMTAAISFDGNLEYSSRVVSLSRPSLGVYEVTFDRSLAGCTVQTTNRTGFQTSSRRHMEARVSGDLVRVRSFDLVSGDAADADFYVTVVC